MTESSRLFFALWPDEETRQALVRLSQSLQLSRSVQANEFKWMEERNLHVTLVFLGHVETAAGLLIKQRADGIASAKPFELTFNQLSYWSTPRVLCLTCRETAQALAGLVADLNTVAAECGLRTDKKPYVPHITLARHARNIPDIIFEPIVWRPEAFCLVESCSEPNGVYYKVIQRWTLIKAVT